MKEDYDKQTTHLKNKIIQNNVEIQLANKLGWNTKNLQRKEKWGWGECMNNGANSKPVGTW